ncbi:carboxypeptidase-like regulatory domain-containing protein [Sandaracinus amylolyticus]|uniref:Outer membrane autotransporter barrel domain protein n=1 Tax=Sandaracinus amylolyticus TaxID=927083 RepID=A0A0F6SDJ2_9BACT|nr:carboxypeptidase-like regulatory domain-containing protein [Sandaracinus amylolyticus]AKF03539.1 outer membrane autotransporter barrel domain protein [Sandaracinus amylolyticus]
MSRSSTFVTTCLLSSLVVVATPGCGAGPSSPMPDAGPLAQGDAAMPMPGDDAAAPEPTTLDVSGTLIDEAGAPVAGAHVHAGGRSAMTDAEGRFAIDALSAPYALRISFTGETRVFVFDALSSATPVLRLRRGWAVRDASLRGAIAMGATPLGDDESIRVGVTTHDRHFDGVAALTHDSQAVWELGATASASLLAVRVREDAEGWPVAYTWLATASREDVAEDATLTGVDLVGTPCGTAHVDLSMRFNEGAAQGYLYAYARVGDAFVRVTDGLEVDDGTRTVAVPTTAGASAAILALGHGANVRAVAMRTSVPLGAEVELTVPDLVLQAPEGAIGPGDRIAWTWSGGDAYFVVELLVSNGDLGYAPYLLMSTNEREVEVPDLADIGIAWPEGRATSIYVYAFAPVEGFEGDEATSFEWGAAINHALSDDLPAYDGALVRVESHTHTSGSD